MTTPLQTLLQLNHKQLELDMVQSWIDETRIMIPANQEVQLELDRQQTSIDEQREGIELLRSLIAMCN